MGADRGHFDKGRWVSDPADADGPSSSEPQDDMEAMEARLRNAAGQIGRGIDELLSAGSDLIGTQEGRQHLGRKLDRISGDLMSACEEIRREGIEFINQARDRIMK